MKTMLSSILITITVMTKLMASPEDLGTDPYGVLPAVPTNSIQIYSNGNGSIDPEGSTIFAGEVLEMRLLPDDGYIPAGFYIDTVFFQDDSYSRIDFIEIDPDTGEHVYTFTFPPDGMMVEIIAEFEQGTVTEVVDVTWGSSVCGIAPSNSMWLVLCLITGIYIKRLCTA